MSSSATPQERAEALIASIEGILRDRSSGRERSRLSDGELIEMKVVLKHLLAEIEDWGDERDLSW